MKDEKHTRQINNRQADTIHLKNSYFESLIMAGPNRQPISSKPFQSILEKNIFPGEFKPRYWLGRVFDKIIQEMNKYLEIKQKLIKDHTKKYEKDGEVETGNSKLETGKLNPEPLNREPRTRKVKKGDPIFLDNGQPDWIDFELYLKEFNELQEIEIDLGIRPIAFDPEKGPDAVGQEMLLLIPLLQEPSQDVSGKVVPFKKK